MSNPSKQPAGTVIPEVSRFPENRENNREFFDFSAIWAIVDAKSRSHCKALACDSLIGRNREFPPHEQGMRNFIISSEETTDSPIPLGAFGNRIPLGLFLPKRGDRRRSFRS